MRLRSALTVVSLSLTGSRLARAEHTQVVELVAPPGEGPDYVCVLNVGPKPQFGSRLFSPDTSDRGTANSTPPPDALGDSTDTGAAWQLLQRSASNDCESGPSACQPRFEAPTSDLANVQVTCRRLHGGANADANTRPQHVAMLAFEVDGTRLELADVSITSANNIAVKVRGNMGNEKVGRPWVRSLGGHYQAGVAVRGDLVNPARVNLSPLCPQRTLLLPALAGDADGRCVKWDVSAETRLPNQRAVELCGRGQVANRAVRVRIPAAAADTRQLRAFVYPNHSCAGDLYTTIRSDLPLSNLPAELEGGLEAFDVSWRLPCHDSTLVAAPKTVGDCPSIRLPDTPAASCKATAASATECVYRCTARGRSVRLPARAVFDLAVRVPDGSGTAPAPWRLEWEDRLEHGGQALSGFVPEEKRWVIADFSSWGGTDDEVDAHARRAGNRVNWVALTKADSTTIPITPNRRFVRVATPGVSCGDSMSYRSIGERDHVSRSKLIQGGTIVIAAPNDTDEAVSLFLHLGAGVEWALALDDDQNRYDFEPARPLFAARLSVEFLPSGWQAWRVAISGYARIAVRAYYPIGEGRDRDSEVVFYNHMMLGLGLVYPLGKVEPSASTWLGFGVLGGGAYATLNRNNRKVGDFRLIPGAYALFRYPLSRRVFAEVAGHVLPLETFYGYETDFYGAPHAVPIHAVIGGLALGLSFGF